MAEESLNVVENLQTVRDALTRAVKARDDKILDSSSEVRLVAVSKEIRNH